MTYQINLNNDPDDFEQEVEMLRRSISFQQFLDDRSKGQIRIPLEEIEREIDEELKALSPDN